MDSAVTPLPEDRVKDASVFEICGIKKKKLGFAFLPALCSVRFTLN